MKKETLLILAVASVAAYFVWKSKKSTPASAEKADVPVEVMEPVTEPVKVEPEPTEKLNANAAVTEPSFATRTFQRPWLLMQNDVKTGYQKFSPFN